MNRGAHISDCNLFRFMLWRIWDETKPRVLFIMLNPSTADSAKDDPTIRKCIGFCRRWGYGGFYVGNLDPYRTASPSVLSQFRYATGYGNEVEVNKAQVQAAAKKCAIVVMAWGVHFYHDKSHPEEYYRAVVGEIPMFCLGKTKEGYPRHPLYVKYETGLTRWPGMEAFLIVSQQSSKSDFFNKKRNVLK